MTQCNCIEDQVFPLPEDVLKLKLNGQYRQALLKIGQLLDCERTPAVLAHRLRLEQHVLEKLQQGQYPYDVAAARKIMEEQLTQFDPSELEYYKMIGAADWMFVDGQVRFNRRFFENLVTTRSEIKRKLKVQVPEEESNADMALRDEQVAYMRAHGGRSAKITVHLGIQVQEEHQRPGEEVLVHLPLPVEHQQVSDLQILSHGPGKMTVSHVDDVLGCVSFSDVYVAGREYWIEYSYINHVQYQDPDPSMTTDQQPMLFLEEQAPHIMFTPYLRALAAEIVGKETNALSKARKIYDFVTTHVVYSYMRSYDTIDCISEYAALNLKGDCGVQAILFITLCRICGIPARWQSGLYVTPVEIGSHDWAMFFVEPFGWMFCDCSFGGGGYRKGATDRWNHYFCNLDVLRLPSCGALQQPLVPSKQFWREDPIDNQVGEFEYASGPLGREQLEYTHRVLSFEWLD